MFRQPNNWVTKSGREADVGRFFVYRRAGTSRDAQLVAAVGKEAYLDKGVADVDVDAYVVLKNSYNDGGEARFYHTETGVNGGKVTRRRVWNEFGALVGGRNSGVQYVGYSLSESFTMNDLHGLLAKFVDGLNAIAGFEAYALTLPDDESECAVISVA